MPTSRIVTSVDDLVGVSLPAVVRPAFTLGGHGGGFADTPEQLRAAGRARALGVADLAGARRGIGARLGRVRARGRARPRRQRRDRLLDREPRSDGRAHRRLGHRRAADDAAATRRTRSCANAAIAVVRAVGVDTGGSNIQFARDRDGGEIRVIEMNPRVSRSSALASKATGYPIAKVAAKLAVGYTLDEIPNDLTGTTPASFEPTLDYVVVKIPRFAFEKFPGADHDARHADEVGRRDDGHRPHVHRGVRQGEARASKATSTGTPTACTPGSSASSEALGAEEARQAVEPPVYRRIDSCAGEVEARVELLLRDLGRAGRGAADRRQEARRHPRLRPEPHRTGRRVRLLLRARRADLPGARLRGDHGQLQPGDGVDGLRHERPPLLRAARHRVGARDLRARAARRRRHPVRRPDAAQARACDRGRRASASSARRSTPSTSPRTASASASCSPSSASAARSGGSPVAAREAVDIADRIGYPVLVRPSYVLGGRAMRVCHDSDQVRRGIRGRSGPDPRRPVPRERDRDRRRRALRRHRHLRRRGHAARRGGGRALRRLGLRAAGAVADLVGDRGHPLDRQAARPRARRRRAS